jgi:hypothetical protein
MIKRLVAVPVLAVAPQPSARPGGAGEERRPPVHYSTGRLTGRQAGVVNRWRARLAEDRPLPGAERVSMAARLILRADNRPKASCSDAVAAAVAELLAAGLDPLAVARYAEESWLAHRAAADGRRDTVAAPVYPGVSWYLPSPSCPWNCRRHEKSSPRWATSPGSRQVARHGMAAAAGSKALLIPVDGPPRAVGDRVAHRRPSVRECLPSRTP